MWKKTRKYQKKIPAIFNFYNYTKRGTDIVDQMNDFYTNQRKTDWQAVLGFYYMLDNIPVNVKT